MLIAALGLIPGGQVTAQTFTTLHSFSAISSQNGPYTNSDGAHPYAGLVLSGSTLYGAANNGGTWENGTLFKVNIDGTGFATLHNFTAMSPDASYAYEVDTNSDGAYPYGSLILCGDTLYGTTLAGGILANGTVFKVTTNGTGFTTLHSFGPTPPYPGPTLPAGCRGVQNLKSEGRNPNLGCSALGIAVSQIVLCGLRRDRRF